MKHITLTKIIALFYLIAFTSCATNYDTKKGFWNGGTGFSETQLGSNIWQIDFTGNEFTNRATTKKFSLKKAAQIAQREGYPYFVVVEGETNRDVIGANYAGGSSNQFFGGSANARTNTATTMTVELLREKVTSRGLVYEARFLANTQ